MNTGGLVIHFSGIVYETGTFRLNVPELQLHPGRVTAVVGHNGAGKTTLLQLIAGFLSPSQGTIRVDGRDPVADLVAVRRTLGWMTDDMAVFAGTLVDNLTALSGFYPTFDKAYALELAERLDVRLQQPIAELSKGEGVRARLVCAMAHRPRWLLLDEPATGLDVQARRALLTLLMETMVDEQQAIVVSSHHTTDIARIADRYLVLDHGNVVADGTATEVVGDHATLDEVLLGVGR